MKIWTVIVYGLLGAIAVQADSDYPKLKLENGKLTVSIYLPDATNGYYRGTRFDWSGIIETVEYADHRFYGPLHKNHNPELHDSIGGPADEFAMFDPMGFSEAAAGESFVKIGVGLLAKGQEEGYQFHQNYRLIRAGEWNIKKGPDWVEFQQNFRGERGWAYDYQKSIRLLPGKAELVIEHRLKNTGEKTIDISSYNHNFTIIDDTAFGPDYSVEFPFSTQEDVSINDLAWFRGNKIEIEKPLLDQSLWVPLFEGDGPAEFNAALIRNNKTGAAIHFQGDTAINRMVFWAVEAAASPEPFIQIHLAPGEAKQWSSHYRFIVDAAE